MPERSVPGIQAPEPGGPSIPPSPIPGTESPVVLDALASFRGRAGVGAAGLVQKRQSAGLLVVAVCGWACDGSGFSAEPLPPRYGGVGVTLKRPGKTPGVISGHKSIAPSSAASNTIEITSALRRRLRARARDSASFSSMHCDKLPRSLTDRPPRNLWHTRDANQTRPGK